MPQEVRDLAVGDVDGVAVFVDVVAAVAFVIAPAEVAADLDTWRGLIPPQLAEGVGGDGGLVGGPGRRRDEIEEDVFVGGHGRPQVAEHDVTPGRAQGRVSLCRTKDQVG